MEKQYMCVNNLIQSGIKANLVFMNYQEALSNCAMKVVNELKIRE